MRFITSSRQIQWCCETNIIFKALFCDTVPHFTTIARSDTISRSTGEPTKMSPTMMSVVDETDKPWRRSTGPVIGSVIGMSGSASTRISMPTALY